MMNLSKYIPAACLRPYIRMYLVIETGEDVTNRVLPDTSLTLTFRFKGQVTYQAEDFPHDVPASGISGVRRSVRLFNYSRGTGNVLILFRDTGAAAFFSQPLHELFEQTVSLNNLVGAHTVTLIEEQLAEAMDDRQRITVIERFLMSALQHKEQDRLVKEATHRIRMAKGIVQMRDFAKALYISQDAFEKRFRKATGTSPKQFSSIVRMKALIQSKNKNRTLTAAAFDSEYFDQPHFNKQFKVFTGQTPTDFFSSPVFW